MLFWSRIGFLWKFMASQIHYKISYSITSLSKGYCKAFKIKWNITRRMALRKWSSFIFTVENLLSFVCWSGKEKAEQFQCLKSCCLRFRIQQFEYGSHTALDRIQWLMSYIFLFIYSEIEFFGIFCLIFCAEKSMEME